MYGESFRKQQMNVNALSLAGRILLGAIFLISGLSKIPNWDATAAMMASQGMPLVPFFLGAAAIVEVGAGIALLLGWRAKSASILLFLYLIPVTLIFHNFWALSGMEQTLQIIMFLKNLSIMGGLLGVAAHGPGAHSLDERRQRRLREEMSGEKPRLRRVS